MAFRPTIASDLQEMDPRIFREGLMELRRCWPMALEDRVCYDPQENLVYVNFEGLTLDSDVEVGRLANFLDDRFAALGRRFHVIVNYDNFALAPAAGKAFSAMVEHNQENYFLSSTRHSTNAFFRRQLAGHLAPAHLERTVYRDVEAAKGALGATNPPGGEGSRRWPTAAAPAPPSPAARR
jgi:propionate CoA-transferase